jgi:predicted ATPase/transcriptional regulator with XRE-family HTH domain
MGEPLGFAAWLKRRRQAHGLTQDELAERVGCATQTIRKIEGRQRRPSYQMADRLAQVLQLDAAEREDWMRAARESGDEPPLSPPIAEPPGATQRPPLPVYLTPFVGREAERADLGRRLANPSCRLVTVLGPGGIGKTRLAVEVVREVGGFPDGVAFVSLAPVAMSAAIVPALADGFGFVFSDNTDLVAQLLAQLRDKRVLLVLDNLEHLLDAEGATVALLGQLLAEAPQLKLLVTSRERLKMQAEWVVELAGLAIPPDDARDTRSDYAAPTLFLQHARRAQPGLRPTPDDERAIGTICRLLGGMPLGIELAATWVMTLSCAAIAAELQRGLDFLTLSYHDLSPRHRSMRAVFEHSWQLLSEQERMLLARIAVFRSGFTREAATFVSRLSLPNLAGLVQKSLVRWADGQRYELHEVTRRFAIEQLDRMPDAELTRQRFLDYYLALAAEASQRFDDNGDRGGLDALVSENENLRVALQQSISHGQAEQGARLATALRIFWALHSQFHEGIAWSERLLAAGGLSDSARGDLLITISYLARPIGAEERSRSTAEEALAAHRQSGDMEGVSWALSILAQIHLANGDYTMARALQNECVAVRRTASGPHLLAWGYIRLLVAELLLGERALAEEHHAEAVRLARSIDDRFSEGGSYCYHGLGLTLLGDPAGAQSAAHAFELLSEPLHNWGVLIALESLAAQAGLRGQHHIAGRLVGAAQRLRQEHQIEATAIYRDDYQRLAVMARGPLGGAAWERAMREGAALSREELLALAWGL